MFKDQVAHTKSSLYDIFYASKAKKTYTNLGVSLILIIVFLGFALVPTLLTLDDIQDSIKEHEELNSNIKNKIDASRSLSIARNRADGGLKNEIDLLEKAFGSDFRLTSAYVNIDRRAEDNSVRITSISPRLPTDGAFGRDSDARVPSESNYELQISVTSPTTSNVLGFISDLEGPENIIIPSRLRTFSIVEATQTTPASAEITIVIYTYSPGVTN